MRERLQRLLNDKTNPYWCMLIEVSSGEISNYMSQIGDYELAEKYHPDIIRFTQDDVLMATDAKAIPSDWVRYLNACIEKYKIPTP